MSTKTLGEVVTNSNPHAELVTFTDSEGARCKLVVDTVFAPGCVQFVVGGHFAALSRDHALALRNHLDAWLRTGSLVVDEAEKPWAFAVECPPEYADLYNCDIHTCDARDTAESIVEHIASETGETDAKIIPLWPRGG